MEEGTFVCETLPNFSELYIGYDALIQAIFDRIFAVSSINPLPKPEFCAERRRVGPDRETKTGACRWQSKRSNA